MTHEIESRKAEPGPVHSVAEELLWTRLLRVPARALHPQRVVLSALAVALIGLLGGLSMPWKDAETPTLLEAVGGAKLHALGTFARGVLSLEAGAVASGFAGLIFDVPRLAMSRYPVEVLLLGLPIALVWSVVGGAVCRSVACEVAHETTHPWTRQLGFSLARWPTMLGATLLPGIVLGLVALVLAIAGFLLFNPVPVLELIGGLLYGVGLALGLGAVALVLAWLLGWPLLLPAAACEGTDAIDAAGRVLAYVAARPVRLLWYLTVGGLLSAVASAVALGLAEGAVAFTQGVGGAWAPARGVAELTGAYPPGAMLTESGQVREVSGLAAASSWMVGLWGSLLRLLAMGYALSCVFTTGTMAYMFIRQICDGQHHAELWTPETEG